MREPSRCPRILFLADRNILADQTCNAFSAFPEDTLVRIEPGDVRKKARVPKNGSLFFTIFQTFMSGPPKDGQPLPYFGEYPPNFFDFVVIDECHRGGANDESNWRINDGFHTPFKVKHISTTLDEYVYTPDGKLIEGEIESGKLYTETDLHKIIEIKEREAHRVADHVVPCVWRAKQAAGGFGLGEPPARWKVMDSTVAMNTFCNLGWRGCAADPRLR
ncbi:MAG: DEAD/DEAH box helicase family protein [Pirellulaceae bacterium]